MIRRLVALAIVMLTPAGLANAGPAPGLSATFPSIDGGTLSLDAWRGQPVLVVNTASQCGFTYQYENMQKVYDRYRNRGLVVLAVPSDDFNQELDSASEVKQFCDLTYGLDFPMTDISHVKGAAAHPFYKAVKAETGFVPRWNFNKVLIGPDGEIAGTWRSRTRPDASDITDRIESLLN
ncbi:MAG: glutathione peroxidase [Marinibacterium sp.]